LLRFAASFSRFGLFVGVLCFCASLSPSLLPRLPVVQGVQSGLAFVAGYGAGVLGLAFWRFVEIKELQGALARWASVLGFALVGVLASIALSRMAAWQNSIRELMEMPDIDSAYPFTVLLVAVAVAVVLLLAARGLIWVGKVAARQVNRALPRRISIALGAGLVVLAVYGAVDGLVLKGALRSMDEMFARIDEVVDDGVVEPAGFDQSLIGWEEIGRNGKRFLSDGPGAAEIAALTGRSSMEPVRVYAGYNTRDTLKERAAIAVADLIRQGGFDRSVLIVATVTGTGWLDPGAIQTVPYLHQGDLSIIAMQYSYLPSWLTLMVDPDRSRLAAKALFDAVYEHWTGLPKGARPQLYLFGLSLGALGSEASIDVVSLLSDPIQGAFWVGPPFASTIWPRITAARNQGSPEWRPQYRDGSLFRFMTAAGFGPDADRKWGVVRVVYLQHGSDPMSWFSTKLGFSRPDWLGGKRAPDISRYFSWYPIVTFVNVGFDVLMATTVPSGYGHNYTPHSYIDGWITVTEPKGWSTEDTDRLKAKFADFSSSPL